MGEKKFFESGFRPSKMDGTEHVFGVGMPISNIPLSYSYRNFLPDVLNQGETSICVPCSISAYLNWNKNLESGLKKDNKVDYMEIYNKRTNPGEGMTFKEAFYYLRHHGVSSKSGLMKINEYCLVRSTDTLKNAIIMNGPCVGALPVYNYSDSFWVKKNGDVLLGYHAIAIVGYNKEGFIIRNSWGKTYGNRGYALIKNEDMNKMVEMWTIL
jgi:hypothetical protein